MQITHYQRNLKELYYVLLKELLSISFVDRGSGNENQLLCSEFRCVHIFVWN